MPNFYSPISTSEFVRTRKQFRKLARVNEFITFLLKELTVASVKAAQEKSVNKPKLMHP